MEIKIEKLKSSETKLTIDLNKKDLDFYLNKTQKTIGESLQIDGFRSKKAPLEAIRKKVGDQHILQEALDTAIKESFAKVIEQEKMNIIETINMKILENKPEFLKYEVVVLLFPEVTLGKYIGVEVERNPIVVSDKEVENALLQVRKMKAKYEDTKMPAEKGNKVEIDFEVKHKGDLIEGGKSENHPLIIGNGGFMPGLEDQLIGMRIEEERDFKISAPKDYWQKNIAGKDLEFKVKMKRVEKIILPEISDDFAKSLGNFQNAEILKKNIKDGIAMEKEAKEKERIRLAILEKVMGESSLEIPDKLIQSQLDAMISSFDQNLHRQGMELGLYLAQVGKTQEDLRKDWYSQAVKHVKTRLVIKKIQEKEKIDVSDEETLLEVNSILKDFRTVEEAGKEIDLVNLKDKVKSNLLHEKTLQILEQSAVIN